MKTLLAIIALLTVIPLFSMDNLTPEQINELENHITKLEFAVNHDSSFASPEAWMAYINDERAIIEKILKAHSIPPLVIPSFEILDTLKYLKWEIADHKPHEPCNIEGLNKADILRALFEAANGGYWPSAEKCPSNDELQKILIKNSYNISCLRGKLIKVDLQGDTFDARDYNRYNGEDAAQRAIEQLRK